MKRTVLPLSLSPTNADALVVAEALKAVPAGGRSAAILHWAAAFLSGQTNDQPALVAGLDMTEDEIDALLDDF